MRSYFEGEHHYPYCGYPQWGYMNHWVPEWTVTNAIIGGMIH